ncbi:MAG: C_GCAxxG_C_C family protein [Clostridia bacterium]|nr:C_GCAxxG_C_C family protein [Clostridia bacterium]
MISNNLYDKKLTKEVVVNMFADGYDCSQVVLSNVCDKLGITKEQALKTAAAFGGGMWHGETCGCVVGALIALGLKYGTVIPKDADGKNNLLQKKAEFEKEFCDKFNSCICREILGHDLSVPEEMQMIQEKKLLQTKCPEVVCIACEILEKML